MLRCDLETPARGPGNTIAIDMVLDTGASESSIRSSLAQNQGLTFEGLRTVGAAGGNVVAVSVGGAILHFDVEDASGMLVPRQFSGSLRLLAENLFGNDILIDRSLGLAVDASVMPPNTTLSG